jgi:fatty-acyl-CoA synthase
MIIGEVRTTGRAGGRRAWAVSTTVGDLYDQTAEAFGANELVFPGERCTYAELADRADAMARSLRGLGVGAGDKVGIFLVPGLDNVTALGAIAKLGAVSVPINARFKERELAHVIVEGDLAVLLVSPTVPDLADYPAMVRAAVPDRAAAPLLSEIVLMGPGDESGFLARAAFDAAGAAIPPAEIDTLQERVRLRDTAIIMYTSGTEANPKGCMLSHEALVRTGLNIAHTRFELTPDDRLWNPLPMFHCGGVVLLMACLSAGTGYVHAGFFDPAVALDQLEQERCTIAHPAFETIWLAVLSHPRFAETDLSAVRIVLNVGVPERLRAMHQQLPNAVPFCSFGSTEACSHLALSRPDDDLEHRFTTGGHPLPGMEVRIVDPETGVDLPPDVEGEVLYRGPDLFDGYYKSPELNARCFDADGWFHSRDVGVLDDDGRLTFRSRLKDMLKVGGENVGAAEIENVIAEHPAVLIIQVVAAPDARYVEVPAAFVQLKAGAECTADEIVAQCVGQIANFKVPRYVRFVDDWPMSGTKIRKVALRERIAAELDAAGITEAPPLAPRPQPTGG